MQKLFGDKIMSAKDKSENTFRSIRKPKEYELYKLWRSLPPMLKHSTDDELRQAGLANIKKKTGLADNDDEDMPLGKLLDIKTQEQFCETYHVNRDTLTDWNKRINAEDSQMEYIRLWTRRLVPNVMMSMYRHIQTKGTPELIKYMLQISEGYDLRDTVNTTIKKANPLDGLDEEAMQDLQKDLEALILQKQNKAKNNAEQNNQQPKNT